MSKVMLKTDEGVKTIGSFVNGIFYAVRRKAVHFYRNENGWAMDREIFAGLVKKGLRKIVIHDSDNNLWYEISMDDFARYGKKIDHKGHREQLVADIDHWEVTKYKPF